MNTATIIMFHYVRNLQSSAYHRIKGLETARFVAQLDWLRKHHSFITIEDLCDCLDYGRSLPANAVLLTFDDGYKDHYQTVFPLLSARGIQGCFYPPAKTTLEHTILDVNKIHFILAACDDTAVLVAELRCLMEKHAEEYPLRSFEDYYAEIAKPNRFDPAEIIFIKRMLQVELPEQLRGIITNTLFSRYIGRDEASFSQELYMNEEELKEMLRAGMHVGSHGYNHYWWNRLSEEAIDEELRLSKSFLEQLGATASPLTACYPYGGYNATVLRCLEKHDFKAAFTVVPSLAVVSPENRFTLQRLDTNDIPVG